MRYCFLFLRLSLTTRYRDQTYQRKLGNVLHRRVVGQKVSEHRKECAGRENKIRQKSKEGIDSAYLEISVSLERIKSYLMK